MTILYLVVGALLLAVVAWVLLLDGGFISIGQSRRRLQIELARRNAERHIDELTQRAQQEMRDIVRDEERRARDNVVTSVVVYPPTRSEYERKAMHPPSFVSRLLTAALGIFAAVYLLVLAVQMIQQIWPWLLGIGAAAGLALVGAAVLRSRYRGW